MDLCGRVIKLLAGFYYVSTAEGVFECRGRGDLKHRNISPLVGDYVRVSKLDESSNVDWGSLQKGALDAVLERKNVFIRPPVANIDYFVAVIAAANPQPNLYILDKSLVAAEAHGVQPIVCINKIDLDFAMAEKIKKIYSDMYPCVALSADRAGDFTSLLELIENGTAVFSGPSGVGKSTLVNALKPAANARIGGTSEKNGRGRHTTRHTEIFDLGNSSIIDTPGFTSFDIPAMNCLMLAGMFPEFDHKSHQCRFDDCLHINEPDCAVKSAIEGGCISRSRYDSYILMIAELEQNTLY